MRKNLNIMKSCYKYKSPDAEAREKAHQFGQPNGNPICPSQIATNQREFYRWAEGKATKEELQEYAKDKTKPFARRRFCELLLSKSETLQDMFDLTNQTHGQPKQVIEQTNLPQIEIVLE